MVLLAFAGGTLGLIFAAWAGSAALHGLPGTLPRAAEVSLDARVLFFTAAISLLAAVLFGLAPALKSSRVDLQDVLREGGRGASAARHRVHGALVAIQVAMA